MKNNTIIFISMLVVIVSGLIVYGFKNTSSPINTTVPTSFIPVKVPTVTEKIDAQNQSYTIEGKTFKLIQGEAIVESAPGSASKQIVRIFGEPVLGDLNGDGKEDAAVLLVNTNGGSGTFYYAVLVLSDNGVVKTTNTLLLGDRIAPQTVEIHDDKAVYNYAERKAGEPMTTQPSIGKSLYVYYDAKSGEIGELVKNFEGEANPSMMSLPMKKWVWVKTQMNDGKVTTPKKADAFTITFTKDGKVSLGTDCNTIGGTYTTNGNKLAFSQMMSTMMYCDGSQEGDFSQAIENVASYLFTSKGELILEIKMDSGTMIFK